MAEVKQMAKSTTCLELVWGVRQGRVMSPWLFKCTWTVWRRKPEQEWNRSRMERYGR